MDMVTQPPYKPFDLIVTRDAFVHLPDRQVKKIINNFNKVRVTGSRLIHLGLRVISSLINDIDILYTEWLEVLADDIVPRSWPVEHWQARSVATDQPAQRTIQFPATTRTVQREVLGHCRPLQALLQWQVVGPVEVASSAAKRCRWRRRQLKTDPKLKHCVYSSVLKYIIVNTLSIIIVQVRSSSQRVRAVISFVLCQKLLRDPVQFIHYFLFINNTSHATSVTKISISIEQHRLKDCIHCGLHPNAFIRHRIFQITQK